MFARLVLISLFALASLAQAYPMDPPQRIDPKDPALVELQKWWTSKNRKPAAAMKFSNGDLSPDFYEFRLKLIGVDKDDNRKGPDKKDYPYAKTADDLERLLTEAQAKYPKFSPDMKYFMGQLLVLKPMRGLVWRVRPLFENGLIWQGNHTMHGPAVTFVRDVAQGMRTFFPTALWEMAFEYVTVPSASMTEADQFKSVSEYQAYLEKEVFPAINFYASEIATIYKQASKSDMKPFVWDNKIIYSKPGLQNDFDTKRVNRFDGFGLPEMALTLAGMYDLLHDGYFFTSYNYDALLNVMGDFGKKFGINQVIRDPGITPRQKRDVIQSYNGKGFMKLKTENGFGAGHMRDYALPSLVNSTYYYREAYRLLQGQPANTAMILNPVHWQANASPRLREGLENMWALVNGPTTLSSPITGETVQIDLPRFYSSPPESLIALMATSFDVSKPKELTVRGNEKLKYRNYFYEMPTGWNNDAWAPYIPSASGKPSDYMRTANRVIFMTEGASMVFGHLDFFVR